MMLSEDTHHRILVAGEELFANHGYQGTTLRQITAAAGANLASVNYYLGDKESLYLEVIRRRLAPVNHERLRGLTDAEREAGAGPVDLEQLVRLLAGPLFALHHVAGGSHGARLLGRALTEPLPFMEEFLAEELQPVLARFAQAIRRHSPSLPPEEFLWRFSFVVGALQHTLATLPRMQSLTRGICRNDDHQAAFERFIPFGVQVLRGS